MIQKAFCKVLLGFCVLMLVFIGVRIMLVGLEFMSYSSTLKGILDFIGFVFFLVMGSFLEDICEEQ